jgi:hypothetical protein
MSEGDSTLNWLESQAKRRWIPTTLEELEEEAVVGLQISIQESSDNLIR